MVQVQAGDEAALAELMGRYRGPLFGFLHRRSDGAAADDLFQEAWIRVVRAKDRFDPRRRFSTWLFQIANNLCRDRARRRATQRRALDEVARQMEDAPASDPPDPWQADRALRLLDTLPGRLREVLVLRYYHDLGEREIAEILGIPRGTVKSRLHKAIAELRAQAEAQPHEPGDVA